MHGFEAQEPTFVDTFRVLNYLLKRHNGMNSEVAAKHMHNIESSFGPEVTEEALHLYDLDVAAEQGTLSYTEDGVAYNANHREESTTP